MSNDMETLGRYVARKWRIRMRAHPVKFNIEQPGAGNTLARQMRRQGYSLDAALLALLGTRERGGIRVVGCVFK